ncbi:MAG: MFS transporter [Chthoniobacteraceae bacterium]
MSDHTPAVTPAHDPYEPFRFRDYRFFATGNFLSVMGRQMVSVAIGWEVYQRTHLASMLGYVGLTLALPTILFAIPAGQLADRVSRKKILLDTQLLTSCSSLGLVVWSSMNARLEWIFVLLFLAATSRTFSWAVRNPFMANLVPAAALGSAVTWNSSTFQMAAVAGPALGGILIAKCGYSCVYGLDALFALAFFAMLLPIAYKQTREHAAQGWSAVFSGLIFVCETKIILATITLDLFAVLLGGATALLPIFADDILHCGPVGLGWLRAAPSVGAFVMGLTIAHLPPMRHAGKAMLLAVAAFGVATVVFGLSHSFWLSIVALGLTGAADNISVIVRHTLVQLLTPDGMRGRVSAVNNVFIGSSNELGAFESGITASWFGPVISVVGGGVATVLVVLGVMRLWPQVLKLGTFASMKPEKVAGEPSI